MTARPWKVHLLIVAALCMGGVCSVHAETYHVATSGKDANPGTAAAPWRTIAKAVQAVKPGDTVLLHSGTYAERLVPVTSGTAEAPITFAAAPGEVATLNGKTVPLKERSGLVHLEQVNHLRIVGLVVTNAAPDAEATGILADGCEDVVIEKNHTSHTTSSGIGVWGCRKAAVNDNDVEHACGGGMQECLSVAGTDGFVVVRNHVHDGDGGTRGKEGICIKDGSANGRVHDNHVHHVPKVGLYVDAWDKHTHDIEVYANQVHDNAGNGFSLASEAGGVLEHIQVYNNLSYDNGLVGLSIGAWGLEDVKHPMKDLRIVNNTFVGNGRGEWGGGITLENPEAVGVVIRNNLVSGNLTFQIAHGVTPEGLVIDHNLAHGPADPEGGEDRGKNAVEAAPVFIDAKKKDYRPGPGSPAVDAGSADGAPADDIEGRKRPSGKGVDIGAYEAGG